MKRRTIRLVVFSGAGLVGLIAVAQAHYGRNATSPPPISVADQADAAGLGANQHAPPPAVADGTATDVDDSAEPTTAKGTAVESTATRLPTRLTARIGSPDRFGSESSLPPSDARPAGTIAPVRLTAAATAAAPIADQAVTVERQETESPPVSRSLLAMADATATPAGADDRYGSAAPAASRAQHAPAAPAGLPPAAQSGTTSQAPIGRLPARPHDRTMQPDQPAATAPAADPGRPATAIAPHFVPSPTPPPLGPASAAHGTPLPTTLRNAADRQQEDPFQTATPIPTATRRNALSATPPLRSDDTALKGGADGTGLPGASDLEGPQAPSLILEKTAPAEIQVGKECTFEIHLRNNGQVPAHGVTVRDEIPQKTRLVTSQPRAAEAAGGQLRWDLGTLNVGEEATIEMHLLPVAEGEVGSVATVEFQSRASVRTVVTKPELAVRVAGPNKVMIGDDVPIQIEVSNPGSGAATGVILLEDVPAGLSHPAGARLELELGTIPAGQQRQLQLVLTAKQAGKITNLLTARADANLSVEAKVDLEVIAPQLKVTIDGPKRRFLDRPATYTLSLENPGTAAAQDVELAAYLPKGMKFVEANNHGQYDATTHSVVWGLEELPAHEHGSVRLVALPVEAGKQMLRAEGRAAQGLTDQTQRDIAVEGVAAIKFEVTDVEDPIEVGGETNYEIRVVNQGSKAATQIQIVVLVPPDMKAVAASGPTQHAMQADRVVFAPLRRLAPKADTTFQVKVQGLAAGDQRLRVQLVTDEIHTPVTKEESTQVYADQ